ncbi:DUF1350 family protein [Acaryochloris sp. IP29b_bin.148]|uniref:DUF1350 family protein n=1 Tax=Acaryochloris sp. IP29b_bin.148 TaxID=2969218 RepID=UPI00261721B8|nr:DUF1350 family protein [Acaryochloris sp. IP29b_bin.148]
MQSTFKFLPLQSSWVAIHPQPIGVVQFIGGAFFGTFPTVFYRYLLQKVYDQGYTIIALPYRFTFRHWSVAIGLVREQRALRVTIRDEAQRRGYAYKIYEEDPTSADKNYVWIGHSLGNKYIALLELLTDLETKSEQDVLGDCVGADQYQEIEDRLQNVDFKDISLLNQPSILMAPAITGIESAIPVPAVAKFVKRLGLDVKPSVEETHCLIKGSGLFGLMGLISFDRDQIARETVDWLTANLPHKPAQRAELKGEHLTPLGYRSGDRTLSDTVLQFLQAL